MAKPIIVNSFFQISYKTSNWIAWKSLNTEGNYITKFSSDYNAAYANSGTVGDKSLYYDIWLKVKIDSEASFTRGKVRNFKIAFPASRITSQN